MKRLRPEAQNGEDSGQSGISGTDSTLRSNSRQSERHVQLRIEFEVSCVRHQMLGNICELKGREHAPPSEEAFFSVGRTSRMYLPRPEKARALLARSL